MSEVHVFAPVIDEPELLVGQVSVGAFSRIEDGVVIDASGRSEVAVGVRSKIKRGCTIRAFDGRVWIGDRVSIGEGCVITGHGGVSIGAGTLLAPQCVLAASQHLVDHTSSCAIRFNGETARGISIGEGAWLGAGVVVLDGVRIGDGAVVGAGAVVTKDLPEYSVSVGVPCRIIRNRTTEFLPIGV